MGAVARRRRRGRHSHPGRHRQEGHTAADRSDRAYGGDIRLAKTTRIGAGWGTYKQIEAVGNVAGGKHGDVLALDGSGVLWLYQGRGDGTFAGRVKVGGGWGGFRELVGAGDLDNDGRPDLIAYGPGSTYGAYVYRSTGVLTAPFNRRTTDLFKYQGSSYSSVSCGLHRRHSSQDLSDR
ncbi:FG-GAP repeat domain-containing protein [Streptomyces sp. NPDC001809]